MKLLTSTSFWRCPLNLCQGQMSSSRFAVAVDGELSLPPGVSLCSLRVALGPAATLACVGRLLWGNHHTVLAAVSTCRLGGRV